MLKDGPLKEAILKAFGTVDAFKGDFNTTTAAIQGSGWGWLVRFVSFDLRVRVMLTGRVGLQHQEQDARDRDDGEPGPAVVACTNHWSGHLGARVLFAVPQRQDQGERTPSFVNVCSS